MKNCLIMGSGRSGTSLMGGILKEAGYYMGDNLYPARNSNPKGFFENAEINGINELILADSFNKYNILFPFSRGKNNINNPGQGQRWLSYYPLRKRIDFINEEVKIRISEAVLKAPFAYKDPRFSFTLSVWQRFVDRETVFICIFREPGITVASILAECNSVKYLKNFSISKKEAYKVWRNLYSHVLDKHFTKMDRERFIFIHYKQLINGEALDKLSDKLGVELNNNFADRHLMRSKSQDKVREKSLNIKIYRRLCQLAGFNKEFLEPGTKSIL